MCADRLAQGSPPATRDDQPRDGHHGRRRPASPRPRPAPPRGPPRSREAGVVACPLEAAHVGAAAAGVVVGQQVLRPAGRPAGRPRRAGSGSLKNSAKAVAGPLSSEQADETSTTSATIAVWCLRCRPAAPDGQSSTTPASAAAVGTAPAMGIAEAEVVLDRRERAGHEVDLDPVDGRLPAPRRGGRCSERCVPVQVDGDRRPVDEDAPFSDRGMLAGRGVRHLASVTPNRRTDRLCP